MNCLYQFIPFSVNNFTSPLCKELEMYAYYYCFIFAVVYSILGDGNIFLYNYSLDCLYVSKSEFSGNMYESQKENHNGSTVRP